MIYAIFSWRTGASVMAMLALVEVLLHNPASGGVMAGVALVYAVLAHAEGAK